MQSLIALPKFFRIPNPGLQKGQIPDPEKPVGDPATNEDCRLADSAADWQVNEVNVVKYFKIFPIPKRVFAASGSMIKLCLHRQ